MILMLRELVTLQKKLVKHFYRKFKLETTASGFGRLRVFGINASQKEDMTVSTDADEMLDSLDENSPTRVWCKQSDLHLNEFENAIFASTNSSLCWIGIAVSPFCSFYASYLQHKSHETKVCHFIEQRTTLQKLRRFVATINYSRSEDKSKYELALLVFADASKDDDNGQLGVLSELLVGAFADNSDFHCV